MKLSYHYLLLENIWDQLMMIKCNPIILEVEQADLCAFEVNLVFKT